MHIRMHAAKAVTDHIFGCLVSHFDCTVRFLVAYSSKDSCPMALGIACDDYDGNPGEHRRFKEAHVEVCSVYLDQLKDRDMDRERLRHLPNPTTVIFVEDHVG